MALLPATVSSIFLARSPTRLQPVADWRDRHVTSCRRLEKFFIAVRERASVAASLRRLAGAIPARMNSWLTGVARRQPVMVRKAMFNGTYSFFVWVLLLQTGAQYSAVEKTSAWVPNCKSLSFDGRNEMNRALSLACEVDD